MQSVWKLLGFYHYITVPTAKTRTEYDKYIFIFLFPCYMNQMQVQIVFSQYLQLYTFVPNEINLEFCSG